MDDRHFDTLTLVLTAGGSRRRLLGLLATLPILGGLLGILAPEEADARGRRKRRKKRHKHGSGRRRTNRCGKGKKPQPSCTPVSVAQTCAGKCGSVPNNCQQLVECGSCACDPACPVCQTCDAATGQCIPDPAQQRDACGAAGQVCLADGTCSCTESSCPACTTCDGGGVCSDPCDGSGCCDGHTCQRGDTDLACGVDGETCAVCTGQDMCTSGVCVCQSACAGKCGGADDGCGGTCPGSCPSGTICDDRICQACDVCASGCEYTTIQAALTAADPGSTVRVCAGTYTIPRSVDLKIERNLTIIGAGSGDGGVIIAGDGSPRPAIVQVASGAVELRDLAVTGGEGVGGGGIAILSGATLTLTRVLVADNDGRYGGGINNFGTVTLNAGTLLTRNASSSGGGIYNKGSAILNSGSTIELNTALGVGGGIYNEGSVTLNAGSSVANNSNGNCVNENGGSGCP